MPKIAYFVHDLNDAAVARRVAMFQAGGAEVAVAGFYRGAAPATVGVAAAVSLGETADARMVDRALAVLRNVALPATARAHAAGADVIVARNLETLAVAVRVAEPGQRVVYECLDIHRLLLADGGAGRLIRAIERRLLRRASMILTSSPAFAEHYFVGRQHYALPIRVEENRVLMLDEGTVLPPPRRPGPPLRIGWFGMLRCRRSLAILRALVRPGEVEVLIAGVPAYTEFEDFDRDVADLPGLDFVGRYTAADLPRLYGSVDIAWAIDYFEEGLNSTWLLPNRLYESLAYGAIPLALSGVETGRWLKRHGVGIVVDDPPALPPLDDAAIASLRAAVAALPRSLLVADRSDCRALTHAVLGHADG